MQIEAHNDSGLGEVMSLSFLFTVKSLQYVKCSLFPFVCHVVLLSHSAARGSDFCHSFIRLRPQQGISFLQGYMEKPVAATLVGC